MTADAILSRELQSLQEELSASPKERLSPTADRTAVSLDTAGRVAMSTTGPQAAPSSEPQRARLWLWELSFGLLLILTILGVAYTSFTKQPIVGYWEILAPMIGFVCVATGWQSASAQAGRLRLIGTQALHWLAFLVVMNMILLPGVQKTFNASATGIAIFTLLALGTFTAGVHVPSWQICLLGLIMALGIPAIAWIENSALIFILIAGGVFGMGTVLWWHWHEKRARKA